MQEFTTGQIRPIECVKEAFELVKPHFWMLFAVSLVGGLIAGASMYVLFGPMVCGIFIAYLKVIDRRGEPVIDDLWKGFKFFGRSVVLTLAFVVPIFVYMFAVFFTLYMPLIAKAIAGSKAADEEILAGFFIALAVDVVIAIGMVAIHSLIIFAFPLMIDRDLSSFEAMKLSARAVMRNLGGVGGLIVVNFGLAIAGYLAFCIGLYLIIPILTATSVVAYRKVFPAAHASGAAAIPTAL